MSLLYAAYLESRLRRIVGVALAANTFQLRGSSASRRDPIDRVQRGVQGSPCPLSGIGFLPTGMESGFVPVGAGEVGWWSGDPCGQYISNKRFSRKARG